MDFETMVAALKQDMDEKGAEAEPSDELVAETMRRTMELLQQLKRLQPGGDLHSMFLDSGDAAISGALGALYHAGLFDEVYLRFACYAQGYQAKERELEAAAQMERLGLREQA